MDMCIVFSLQIIERWKKKVNHKEMLSSWLGDAIILDVIKIRLDLASSNNRIWWFVEHLSLLSDVYDTQLKIQNMTGMEKQKPSLTGL